MPLLNVTRQVVINGVDVTADCEDIQVIDTCVDYAMPSVKITLHNIAGKYATAWPPFGETGLYYPGYVKFNSIWMMQFRFEGLDPDLSTKNTIIVDGLVVGGTTLQKQYVTANYYMKADDVIQALTTWASSGASTSSQTSTTSIATTASVTYTSPSLGTVIPYNANREYCSDIIRKILEQMGWTATLRANSQTQGGLDVFTVTDPGHQHSTIFQSGQIIRRGKSPRDLKASPNIIEVVGGKSQAEPSDMDNWTESVAPPPGYTGGPGKTPWVPGKANCWHSGSGFGNAQSCFNAFLCGYSSIMMSVGKGQLGDNVHGVYAYLDLQAALGGYLDAITRSMSAINFAIATNNNMGAASFQVKVGVEDDTGNRIMWNGTPGPRNGLGLNTRGIPGTAGGFQNITCPFSSTGIVVNFPYSGGTPVSAGDIVWYINPGPYLGFGGTWTADAHSGVADSDGVQRFHMDKLAKIYIYLVIAQSGFPPTFNYPLNFYLDCFYMSQNYTPIARAIDTVRVAAYDPRMQQLNAPEYTELADLENYAVDLLQASAAPTYNLDLYVDQDPSVELIKAGWQVRFNWPEQGISSSIWWRVLEAGWMYSKAEGGLVLHLIAVPVSTGYSKSATNKIWTKTEEGQWKNVIDAVLNLRRITKALDIHDGDTLLVSRSDDGEILMEKAKTDKKVDRLHGE